jgi:hypothetical protein
MSYHDNACAPDCGGSQYFADMAREVTVQLTGGLVSED